MTPTSLNTDRQGEQGNVLFLILIAVALFAALSYAVTQSSRSGGGDANSEKSLVSSSQLTQYPAGVRTAIVRMIVSGNVASDELLFTSPSDFGLLTTDAMKKDAVFYPSTGGGATYATGPATMMASGSPADWVFSSHYAVQNIGITSSSDNTGNDIIAFLSGVSKSVCVKLDEQLGISLNGSDPSTGELAASVPASENMDTTNTGIPTGAPSVIIGSTDTVFAGQPFGCMKATDGTYVYYHVLIER